MAFENYLFGPSDAEFATDYLGPPRRSGHCLAFGPGAEVDPAGCASWQDFAAQLPAEWVPGAVVVRMSPLPPAFVWTAPVPVVGLASDWHLHWHAYRWLVPLYDAVLCDDEGVERMRRAGWGHALLASLCAAGEADLAASPAVGERDIDIAFAGGIDPAAHAARLPWLARLAALSGRYRVAIVADPPGADRRELFRRTKLVFTHAVIGEFDPVEFAAAASGAVVLREAGRVGPKHGLRAGVDCLTYRDADFEEVAERALADPGGLAGLAERARQRVQEYPFHKLLADGLGRLDSDRVRQRAAGRPGRLALAPIDLSSRSAERDDAALRRSAAGGNRVSRIALGDRLVGRGSAAEAVEWLSPALRTLAVEPMGGEECDSPTGPPGRIDEFRVAWERAAWASTTPVEEAAAKTELARWWCHLLLGEATGDPGHFREAVLLRPGHGPGRAALGSALARRGDLTVALPHFRAAHLADPFDLAAARLYGTALADAGAATAARRLGSSRRLLSSAAPTLVPREAWFAPPGGDPAALAGDELTSVIVLCHDQLDYTRLCLDSVAAHTRPPFEVVVVDNGSGDGTPGYLAGLAGRLGLGRLITVRSEANLGFAAGVNRGIEAAGGEWLVLLNNDAVVTPRWLDRLLDAAAGNWPGAGLVGPVSNGAPAPQYVRPGYADLAGLDEFAESVWSMRGPIASVTPRLTGFCLALHRSVAERLGPLDEGYGLGFFEDDDWCARARDAGLRMLVAEGVYVHHFGGRTCAGLGIDVPAALGANFLRFRAKWGDRVAAPYRPPRKCRVSLTVIARDEEANLPDCLGGLGELFDEVVVVDTGSTDATREVARSLGAAVYETPWIDDFSAARNTALGRATGDYVFWLDADDRLDARNRGRLASLFATLGPPDRAWSMKCVCRPGGGGGSPTVVDHVRLFPRLPGVRWEFRVHEQILPSLRRAGVGVEWSDIAIDHAGYADPALRARKLSRDLRLLELELADRPGHPFALFNLGSARHELGDDAGALDCLSQSLAASDPRDSIVRKLYALIAASCRRLGRQSDSDAAVSAGLSHYPLDAELLYLDALARRGRGDLDGAEASLRRLLGAPEPGHFASVDRGIRGGRATALLAEILAGRAGVGGP